MSARITTLGLILALVTLAFTTDAHSQGRRDAAASAAGLAAASPANDSWETVVVSLSNASRDMTRTLGMIYADSDDILIYPDAKGSQLVLRMHANLRDEVIALIKKLDRPTRMIENRIQLLQVADGVELDTDALSSDLISALVKADKAVVIDEIRMSGLENIAQSAQYGRTIRQKTSSQRAGSRGDISTYQQIQVGSTAGLIGRIADDGTIVLEVEFEKTAPSDDPDQDVTQIQFRSTLRLVDGVPSVANVYTNKNGKMWLLVTARTQATSPSPTVYGSISRVQEPRSTSNNQTDVLTRYIDRVFERFDENADGALTSDEVPQSIQASDKNEDGTIERSELRTQFENMRRGSRPPSASSPPRDRVAIAQGFARRLFERYDENQDGKLDADERAEMNGRYERADANGDAIVTLKEMTDYFTSQTRDRSP